jgi:hypothetical protein
MTLESGYALGPQDALEDLDMTGGSVLSLKVTGQQSNGFVTVLEGVVLSGGPPLHVHEAEDEVVICLEGELAYQLGESEARCSPVVFCGCRAGSTCGREPLRRARALLTVVTPSGIEDFFRAQRDYLAEVSDGHPFDPAAFGRIPGHETRTVVGPPLS